MESYIFLKNCDLQPEQYLNFLKVVSTSNLVTANRYPIPDAVYLIKQVSKEFKRCVSDNYVWNRCLDTATNQQRNLNMRLVM